MRPSLKFGCCEKDISCFSCFQCNPGVAIYQLFKVLNQQPTKIMMLGCGCSITSEATAQVTHLFNLTQVSESKRNGMRAGPKCLGINYKISKMLYFCGVYK